MTEAIVEQAVKTYFTDQFPQFSVSEQCAVSFGTQHRGIADVVLYMDENGYFVAIAECKRWPLPIPLDQAKAQLKSYMSATNTRYGVLAIGTDVGNWEFCENKYNNRFVQIGRKSFERGIKNWMPLDVRLQREQKTTRWWKRIALTLGVVFILTCSSLLWLWPDPPEPIVYITRTGKKYHTYNCEVLEEPHVKYKLAMYFDEAEKNYDPCGICYSYRTETSR